MTERNLAQKGDHTELFVFCDCIDWVWIDWSIHQVHYGHNRLSIIDWRRCYGADTKSYS